MKIIALCLLTLTVSASAAPTAGAPELEKLRASYKAAIAKGTKSVVQAHITTLDKLRDIYARGGNLAGANKVQADIDRANVAMTTGELLSPAADADNVPAPELDKLRAGHDADIERAVKPYRETYLRELDKLRDNYTRAANLAAANEVQAEIDGAKPGGGEEKPGGQPGGKAEEYVAAGKQPRLTGKPPKMEWYIGKTWVADSGASWTFAKGGGGEVYYPTRKKRAPMTWEVMPSGMIKMRHEASTSKEMITDWVILLISATDGLVGTREALLDHPLHPQQ